MKMPKAISFTGKEVAVVITLSFLICASNYGKPSAPEQLDLNICGSIEWPIRPLGISVQERLVDLFLSLTTTTSLYFTSDSLLDVAAHQNKVGCWEETLYIPFSAFFSQLGNVINE